MADLRAKAEENKDDLAALMITYLPHTVSLKRKLWKSATSYTPAARRYIWTVPT